MNAPAQNVQGSVAPGLGNITEYPPAGPRRGSGAGPGPGPGPGLGPMPQRTSSPSSDFNASPRPRPAQPGGRSYPNSHRFTLTDAPTGAPPPNQYPGPGPGRTQSASPQVSSGRPNSRPPAGRIPSSNNTPQAAPAPAAPRPTRPGATTFAEMGITAGKAEEKECIIM